MSYHYYGWVVGNYFLSSKFCIVTLGCLVCGVSRGLPYLKSSFDFSRTILKSSSSECES